MSANIWTPACLPQGDCVRTWGGRKMQPETKAIRPPQEFDEETIHHELQEQVGPRHYEHWFHKKITLSCADDELIVGVGSPFLLAWMQKHFRSEVTRAAQSVLGPSARVRFEVDARVALGAQSEQKNPSKPGAAAAGRKTAPAARPAGTPAGGRRFANLADFVQGECNLLAATAARQICETPGERFNPLFLHGGVGTGKTHLLEGIYRRTRRTFPSLQVMFLTAEAFTNYFTQALREHTLPGFRQRFRNVDVLLVDDIDFLDAKRVIQEEFLHTFQQLESHGRQIVLTSDRHPRLLSKLSDELVTRFLSGLVCRIEPPDLETRKHIVERKAAHMKGGVSAEALTFVAGRFKNNVREVLGALNCLETYHHMTQKRIGLSAARNILADLERDCIRIVRISDVEEAVCTLFGLEAKDLKSSRRHRSVSQPRMLAMFLARKHTQAAYSEIGHYFGGRNHSTVISAEKKVKHWLNTQTLVKVASQTWPVADILESLEQQLDAG